MRVMVVLVVVLRAGRPVALRPRHAFAAPRAGGRGVPASPQQRMVVRPARLDKAGRITGPDRPHSAQKNSAGVPARRPAAPRGDVPISDIAPCRSEDGYLDCACGATFYYEGVTTNECRRDRRNPEGGPSLSLTILRLSLTATAERKLVPSRRFLPRRARLRWQHHAGAVGIPAGWPDPPTNRDNDND